MLCIICVTFIFLHHHGHSTDISPFPPRPRLALGPGRLPLTLDVLKPTWVTKRGMKNMTIRMYIYIYICIYIYIHMYIHVCVCVCDDMTKKDGWKHEETLIITEIWCTSYRDHFLFIVSKIKWNWNVRLIWKGCIMLYLFFLQNTI